MSERFAYIGEVNNFNGIKVEAEIKNPLLQSNKVTSTDIHEIAHAILAPENVVEVSSVPGVDYEGMTMFDSFQPVAAVGPESEHMSGTGYDVFLVESMGLSVEALKAQARVRLDRMYKYREPLEKLLAAKGTITGAELRSTMKVVDEGYTVTVRQTSPDGITEETEIEGVDIDANVVEIPMAEGEEYSPEYNGANESDEEDETSESTNNIIRYPRYPKSNFEVA